MERRPSGAQSGPKAAEAGKESSCLAGVALELTPTQKPGTGPGPRRHTEPLASRPGEKRAFLCLAPVSDPEAGPRPGMSKPGSAEGCSLASAGPSSPGPASARKELTAR